MSSSVLITGSTRGLGAALAAEYLARGNHVVASGRGVLASRHMQDLRAQFGDRMAALELDVCDDQDLQRISDWLYERHRPIDVLINNAGVGARTLSPDPSGLFPGTMTRAALTQLFAVNSIAPSIVCDRLLPHLGRSAHPRVVNISSDRGAFRRAAGGGSAAYAASKAALNMLTKELACDPRYCEVIIIALHPGHLRTALGGEHGDLYPESVVGPIVDLVENLDRRSSGGFFSWNGQRLAW